MMDNQNISNQLIQIQKDLDFIKSELKEIKSGTNKMESHITFVDSVYNQVKSPFHYVMDLVSKRPIKCLNYNKANKINI